MGGMINKKKAKNKKKEMVLVLSVSVHFRFPGLCLTCTSSSQVRWSVGLAVNTFSKGHTQSQDLPQQI